MVVQAPKRKIINDCYSFTYLPLVLSDWLQKMQMFVNFTVPLQNSLDLF